MSQITIQDLTQREVIYCVSSLIDTLTRENKLEEELALSLWQGAIDYEAAEYEINQDGSSLAKREGLWGLHDNDEPDNPVVDYDYEDKEELIDWYFNDMGWSLDDHRSEVYEHWLVSSWLAKKLQEKGETIVECYGLTIWARGCSGQSIYCDSVIQDIYQELIA